MHGRIEYLTEFDSIKDIDRLRNAIENGGWNVADLGFGEKFIKNILKHEIDIVFNYAVGFIGSSREAQIPSTLEMVRIPVIGSNAFCLVLTQNKHICYLICKEKGLPVPKGGWINDLNINMEFLNSPGFPLIIKPCREGSSYGISHKSVVKNLRELKDRANITLKRFKQPVIVQEYIQGKEICAGIIGNDPPKVLPLVETIFDISEVSTYEMKRDDVGFSYKKANISSFLKSKIENIALNAYKQLYCTDYARIDFRVDFNGNPYIIDVNATPELKEHCAMLFSAYLAGYSYDDFIKDIIDKSLIRNSLI